VQGGIGYWQWFKANEPEKFNAMAARAHKITDLKGKPVTICKDQSKVGGLVFILPHPNYPEMKEYIELLGSNFNEERTKIYENDPSSELTSFSVNKGEEVAFCLKSKKSGELHKLERRQPTLENIFLRYIGHTGADTSITEPVGVAS
jgi:hypothetical protein